MPSVQPDNTYNYEYDENGNLKKTIDPASRVINYTYNTANLVKGVELPANPDAGIT